MALALGVRFVPASAGTVDFVYASTVTGYRVATSVLVNSSTYRYRAESADLSQWEYGTAIWSSTTSTLSRNTITDSSNAGAKVNFTSAPQVAITIDVPDVLSFDTVMSLTTAQKKQAQLNIFVPPTTQILTSGTTYTTPTGCLWIEVFMVGGGGGGAGTTSGVANTVAGSDGTASTFNSVNANPGKGASVSLGATGPSPGGAGGTGGTGTATDRMPGTPGTSTFNTSTSVFPPISGGGSSVLFGGGAPPVSTNTAAAGNAGAANTGGGGGGAYNATVTNNNAAGGGGGAESVYLIISSPASTVAYAIGAGGAGGVSTNNGGTGAAGKIRVVEHYGS